MVRNNQECIWISDLNDKNTSKREVEEPNTEYRNKQVLESVEYKSNNTGGVSAKVIPNSQSAKRHY